jgi:hypothetical protein
MIDIEKFGSAIFAARYLSGESLYSSSSLQDLMRPLAAIALACLVYDQLTHFDDELSDVWFNLHRQRWIKLVFLCGRYGAGALVVYTAVGEVNKRDLWISDPMTDAQFFPSHGRLQVHERMGKHHRIISITLPSHCMN